MKNIFVDTIIIALNLFTNCLILPFRFLFISFSCFFQIMLLKSNMNIGGIMFNENLNMFKAYDVRTKNESLSDKGLFNLASAVAAYYALDVKVKSLIIARDARLACPRVMEALVEKALEAGLDVLINPIQISTCQFYFMCMKNIKAGGVMITASHNPKEYIGMKFVGKEVSPIASDCGILGGITGIKRRYQDEDFHISEKKGSIKILQLQKEYVEYTMKLAGVKKDSLKGMKVFGEFLSGAAGLDFTMAMNAAGVDFTPSNLIPDGNFPHGEPNPIIENSIAPARLKVKNGGYDIGFCLDGDGDRIDFMFGDGSQIIPGLNMSAIIPYIKEIFKDTFDGSTTLKCYVDVKAIPLSLIEIASKGIEQHIIRNGHSFIKDKLMNNFKEGFIVAEEESAHYYMNFPVSLTASNKKFVAIENTLFFALLTLRALKEYPDVYLRIKKLQKGIFRFKEWPLNFNTPEKMEDIMDEVEACMKEQGASIIKTMDDKSDLDATLMRFSLPDHITPSTPFPSQWAQVAQRISRSEDAMTRWEIVASSQELCNKLNNLILSITDKYVEAKYADY